MPLAQPMPPRCLWSASVSSAVPLLSGAVEPGSRGPRTAAKCGWSGRLLVPRPGAPRRIFARARRARCAGRFHGRWSPRNEQIATVAPPRRRRAMASFRAKSSSGHHAALAPSRRADRADRAHDSAMGPRMPPGRERAAAHSSAAEHGPPPGPALPPLLSGSRTAPANLSVVRRLGVAALLQRARRC